MPGRATSFTTTDGQTREIKDQYPSTRTVLEVIKVAGGRIAGSEGIAAYEAYYMPSPWKP